MNFATYARMHAHARPPSLPLGCTQLIGGDLTERNAALCFVWSRLCVPAPYSERGEVRMVNLPFEGFLEAIW